MHSRLYNCLAFLLLFYSQTIHAQITTSEIKGQVIDNTNTTVPGALVRTIHLPTGTVYNSRSSAGGDFFVPNLKPGGPYAVSIEMSGFQSFQDTLFLELGETKNLKVNLLPTLTELEGAEVVQSREDYLNNQKKGASTNIGLEEIGKLPTLNRSLQDLTRVSPQTAGNSYAGANYRYNNLSIDGVANNDAFGFQEPSSGAGGSTAAGSPGALSKVQPISLDAIAEIQISTSPYDVKLGNFTGGSLNVVTRSGTNKTEGSVYSFSKTNRTTGRSPDQTRDPMSEFYSVESGFRVGGAIKKNKFFYFVNAEHGRRSEPLQFAPGSPGSIFSLTDIAAFYDTVLNRYGYDLGTYGDRNLLTTNSKVFLRFDYNFNENNQLIVRHNVVSAQHDNLSRSGVIFNYESQGFNHQSVTNSSVVELKSKLSSRWFNNAILGYSRIHDSRQPFGDLFPHLEINYNTAGVIFAGSYREASVYQMFQNAFELTDNLTFYLPKHKLTFGTHNELYRFQYHFVTPFTGRWAYNSLDDFYANRPSRIRGTYSLIDPSYDYNYNNPSADFHVLLSSFYVQDDYSVNNRLKLSYGVRLEGNMILDGQNYAEEVRNSEAFGAQAGQIKNTFILAPRVGFNYDILANQKWKLRGGSGIFSGRMPFAWAAYSYIYSGSQFGSIDIRPNAEVELITDDFQNMANLQPGKKEINIVDPNFKLPRVLRSNLATDIQLPRDFKLTLEGIYTQTIYDIYFQTLNLKDSTGQLPNTGDDRPIYLGSGDAQRVDPAFANVFYLTNTRLGYRYQLSASLQKKFKRNINAMVAYTYGMSKDLMNGVRVSPQANWEWNQTTQANNPALSFSNFDLRHRIVSAADITINWKKKWSTLVSVFAIASSGSPFTYVYAGDLNRDASSNNDLIYVPVDRNDINLVDIKDANGNVVRTADQQWQDLDNYILNDEYLQSRRGQFTERNGGRTPWNVQVDMHLGQDFTINGPRRKHTFRVTADIFNFTNLLNYKWGRQYFVPNTTNAGYALITAKTNASGVATYTFNNPTSAPWQIDNLASRLQMQVGLRYAFN